MLLDGCAVSSPCVPRGQPGAPAATAGAYPTVGGEPAWARRLNPGRLAGLRRIGIDEFSYRKRHHYLTVVVDHDTRRVVWAGKGAAPRRWTRSSTCWDRPVANGSRDCRSDGRQDTPARCQVATPRREGVLAPPSPASPSPCRSRSSSRPGRLPRPQKNVLADCQLYRVGLYTVADRRTVHRDGCVLGSLTLAVRATFVTLFGAVAV